jgi:hypothetical protein
VLDLDVVEHGNDFRNVVRGLSSWNIPLMKDACREIKLGKYWRVEEDNSESVTVRGGMSSFEKRLLHKKYKVAVEEPSKVFRLLEEMRK